MFTVANVSRCFNTFQQVSGAERQQHVAGDICMENMIIEIRHRASDRCLRHVSVENPGKKYSASLKQITEKQHRFLQEQLSDLISI